MIKQNYVVVLELIRIRFPPRIRLSLGMPRSSLLLFTLDSTMIITSFKLFDLEA